MKRIRIGLRLMLLLVALFCVCCAYLRARMDLRRTEIDQVKIDLEGQLANATHGYNFILQQLAETKAAGPTKRPYYQNEITSFQRMANERTAHIARLKKQLRALSR